MGLLDIIKSGGTPAPSFKKNVETVKQASVEQEKFTPIIKDPVEIAATPRTQEKFTPIIKDPVEIAATPRTQEPNNIVDVMIQNFPTQKRTPDLRRANTQEIIYNLQKESRKANTTTTPTPTFTKPEKPGEIAKDFITDLFPPVALIKDTITLQETQPETVNKFPQIIAETIFPPAPLITGELAPQTLSKSQASDMVTTAEKYGAPPEVVLNIQEAADQVITAPNIVMPDPFKSLKDLPKYLLYGGLAIGGIYLLGKFLGRKK